MARLIIGHVTHESAHIWVRGTEAGNWAKVTLSKEGETVGHKWLQLEQRHGYTGCLEFKKLSHASAYQCQVAFSHSKNTPDYLMMDFGHCRGKFKTAPKPKSDVPVSFILGSCNLHSLGIFSSPDTAYEKLMDKAMENDCDFMLHCGDQIYYDIPNPAKSPSLEGYRQKYLDAWGDCRPARALLTQLPHYMILDDHEITNDFANDFNPPGHASTAGDFKRDAMKVYREFVHIRQPNPFPQSYYYWFSFGRAEFFVMDTRTERWAHQKDETDNQIVSQTQLDELKKWLSKHAQAPKFIVTSVPFVGHVRNNQDKWCHPIFSHQREQLIDFIAANKLEKICFLTGDMHSSYHATMEIQTAEHSLMIHELMSSPINQLHKSNLDDFHSSIKATTKNNTQYHSRILKSEFYNEHSNALLIRLEKDEVQWEIFRTKRKKSEKNRKFNL